MTWGYCIKIFLLKIKVKSRGFYQIKKIISFSFKIVSSFLVALWFLDSFLLILCVFYILKNWALVLFINEFQTQLKKFSIYISALMNSLYGHFQVLESS
jgi:cbb3-type cytochrome oxidase subunit 1